MIPRQLSLLKGPRQKGEVLPDPLEFEMQCYVADRLRWGKHPDWFASHIGHGERRDRATAVRLKRSGVMPGLPDNIIVGPSGFYFLELKRRPNGLTPEQKIFCDIARAAGGTFAVAYDQDEAVDILGTWGALRR